MTLSQDLATPEMVLKSLDNAERVAMMLSSVPSEMIPHPAITAANEVRNARKSFLALMENQGE